MAKFEITAEDVKGKSRKPKVTKEERPNETNEDEKQQEYLDIEQEVKETESKKEKPEGESGEATIKSADAATTGGTTNEAERRKTT